MAEIVDYYYETGEVAQYNLYNGTNTYRGQSFKNANSSFKLTSCKFHCTKAGTITGNIYAYIYAHTGTFGSTGIPTGSYLAISDAKDASTITTGYNFYEWTFSGSNQITLSANTPYCVVVSYTGGDANNYFAITVDTISPTHQGNTCFSTDGSSWGYNSNYDFNFYVYGDEIYSATTTLALQSTFLAVPSPTLVSPSDTTTGTSPVTFIWKIPTGANNRPVHAHIQIDKTSDAFGDLEKDLYSHKDAGFEYYNGTDWVAYPITGVTSDYYGNQARITLNLTTGWKYWRVRGGVALS